MRLSVINDEQEQNHPLRASSRLSPPQRIIGSFSDGAATLSNVSAGRVYRRLRKARGPFDFVPAHTSHSGFIERAFEPLWRRKRVLGVGLLRWGIQLNHRVQGTHDLVVICRASIRQIRFYCFFNFIHTLWPLHFNSESVALFYIHTSLNAMATWT